jgi:hypothetical protein
MPKANSDTVANPSKRSLFILLLWLHVRNDIITLLLCPDQVFPLASQNRVNRQRHLEQSNAMLTEERLWLKRNAGVNTCRANGVHKKNSCRVTSSVSG